MKTFYLNQIKNKRIYGRNKESVYDDKTVNLLWAADSLEINVKANECWINLSSSYSKFEIWVAVEINGYQTSRFIAPVKDEWICIARNLNPQKENIITIIKETQVMAGEEKHNLCINQIGLDDEGDFVELKKKDYDIEFVGDSITSGEGLAGNYDEMDWITQWFCASKTFAVQASKKINASWSVLSQCGWGVGWGWDGNPNSNMPSNYENICSILSDSEQKRIGIDKQYSFNSKKDFIVVNLGTNDENAFNQPPFNNKKLTVEKDSPVVIQNIYDFLVMIRKHNKDSKIIWCYGMIKLKIVPELIKKAVKKYKKDTGDDKVFLLEFEPLEKLENKNEEKGSRGHPGLKTHIKAAEKLADFIQKNK